MPDSPVCAFIDPAATLHPSVRVWHFSVILAGVVVGARTNIGSRCEIGRDSLIGEDTRVGSGVFLPPRSFVGDRVFIGPNVTFTDDPYPRAGNTSYTPMPPRICHGASIGAGAVILPGITIGHDAMVGAGAVITRDVPPGAIVRGEPARQLYPCPTPPAPLSTAPEPSETSSVS